LFGEESLKFKRSRPEVAAAAERRGCHEGKVEIRSREKEKREAGEKEKKGRRKIKSAG
jgi:hypothetical protein